MGCDCVRLRGKPNESTTIETQASSASRPKPRAKKHTEPGADFELSQVFETMRQLTKPLSAYYQLDQMVERDKGRLKEYEGVYISTGQKVTIKEFAKEKCQSVIKTKKKLIEETEKLYQLDHPHIVRLFELWEDERSFFMISESLKGGSLECFLTQQDRLPESQAATLLYQLLRAVSYCHAQGLSGIGLNLKRVWLKNQPGQEQLCLKIMDIETTTPAAKAKMIKIETPSIYSAPEEFIGNQSEKSDIWACGAIFAVLLTNKQLITSKKYSGFLSGAKRFQFPFLESQWSNISSEAKTLLSLLMTYDAKARPSALECINNAWLTQQTSATSISSKQVKDALSSLKSVIDTNPLKKAVKKLIITRGVQLPQIDTLVEIFELLDKDHNGCIGATEIKHALEKIVSISQAAEETDQIMKNVGENINGHLSFTNFLTCSYNERQLLSDEYMIMAFNIFDRDHSGRISLSEIKAILSIAGSKDKEQSWKILMKMADISGDGEVDYGEFEALMRKGASSA